MAPHRQSEAPVSSRRRAADLRPCATLDAARLQRTGVILTLLLLAACSLPGSRQTPTTATYLLEAVEPQTTIDAAASEACLILRVNPANASPGYRSARMAYTQTPHRLDYFAYHAWVGAPAQMVTALIRAHSEASGLFRAVIAASPALRADLRLDAEVIRLVQIFGADGSQLHFAVKTELIDTTHRTLLASRRFVYKEPALTDNPEAGVDAANRAAARFTRDLTDMLAGVIATVPCPPEPQE